jgi:hypothetical protein
MERRAMQLESGGRLQAASGRRSASVPVLIGFVGRIKPKVLSAIVAPSADNAARYSPYVEIAA